MISELTAADSRELMAAWDLVPLKNSSLTTAPLGVPLCAVLSSGPKKGGGEKTWLQPKAAKGSATKSRAGGEGGSK